MSGSLGGISALIWMDIVFVLIRFAIVLYGTRYYQGVACIYSMVLCCIAWYVVPLFDGTV